MARAHLDIAPFDLGRSLGSQRFGAYDPTVELSDHRLAKCFSTREGLVRAAVETAPGGISLEVEGPSAEQILQEWLASIPPDDGHERFDPQHPLLQRLNRGLRGMRFLPVPWLHDVACRAVLEQRVTYGEAVRTWSAITRAHGERGALGVSFPSADALAKIPVWELQRLGMDVQRARTLLLLSRDQRRHSLATGPFPLEERLLRIPGIGPWTVGTVMGQGRGNPDAVVPGDLHFPHLVCFALAGEPRGSDERMLELLEPHRGHRYRVLRLLMAAGIPVPQPPRKRWPSMGRR